MQTKLCPEESVFVFVGGRRCVCVGGGGRVEGGGRGADNNDNISTLNEKMSNFIYHIYKNRHADQGRLAHFEVFYISTCSKMLFFFLFFFFKS